jgi:UDP-arabinose 4-epimerase
MSATAARPAVLVTGGAGYVGSHACKALARAGFLPVVYDNLERGHAWAVKWGPLERGDLGDAARLAAVVESHAPVAAMHFAAYTYVDESLRRPDLYYRNNVVGALVLLEALRRAKVAALVFSSTCAVYGMPQSDRLAEDHPHAPITPYGASKSMIERVLRDYAALGMRTAALRYFNAAGADPELEIGEAHEPETHLIPLAIRATLGQAGPITVFGTDYPTPDGTCIRDYVHVSDLADAHVEALKRLLAGADSFACNLGVGRGASVREVIAAVEASVGRPAPVAYGPRRPGDPHALVADPSLAGRLIDWKPTRSSLRQIVDTAVGWARVAPA